MRLYELERSGNCYKARLMLSLLGLAYERVTIDLSKGEQKKPEFLAINPLGNIPVLDDDGTVIRDSAAILVYLAAKYGKGQWYPSDPVALGSIQQWLAVSSNEIFHGLALTRAIKLGLRQGDYTAHEQIGLRVLGLLEQHLKGRSWLALAGPSVADVACYAYVAMIPHAGIALDAYPSVLAWTKRVEALPGYTAIPAPPAKA